MTAGGARHFISVLASIAPATHTRAVAFERSSKVDPHEAQATHAHERDYSGRNRFYTDQAICLCGWPAAAMRYVFQARKFEWANR